MPRAAFPWQKDGMKPPGRSNAPIGSHRRDAELASHGRLFTHAGVVETAANGRDASSSELLHGLTLTNGKMAPRLISLRRGTVLLLPFVLWSPERLRRGRPSSQTGTATGDLRDYQLECQHRPGHVPSNEISTALREWQWNLPANVHMVIVPDAELSVFHVDSFPAGVGIATEPYAGMVFCRARVRSACFLAPCLNAPCPPGLRSPPMDLNFYLAGNFFVHLML